MGDCVQSVLAVWLGVAPAALSVDAADADAWLKLGGLAALVFLLTRQLVIAWNRNAELSRQLNETMQQCKTCPLAQAANNRAVKEITEDFSPQEGRMH